MAKSPYSSELRIRISQEYLDGYMSSNALAKKYDVNERTVERWAQRYKEQGSLAFVRGAGNTKYTSDFKTMCVALYLKGKMSVDEIVAKYNISDKSVLNTWIKYYNANRELKDYNPKREVYMAEARRKTTLGERKEIVDYCISHNRNYKEAASLFNVSYSQVYSWVKKYDVSGEAGLSDRRGNRKTDEEMNELERLRRENLRLKRQLEEKDMVVELLKKVKELEGM
jgi:Transposase and inactivated derivatives